MTPGIIRGIDLTPVFFSLNDTFCADTLNVMTVQKSKRNKVRIADILFDELNDVFIFNFLRFFTYESKLKLDYIMHFDILRQTRKNQLSIIEQYDLDQLNTIPDGFNNNLIWNLGHVIVTQQLLCYKLSGNRLQIDTNLVDKYRKGSKPEAPVDEAEFKQLKDYVFSTVDQMEVDFNAGLFKSYKPYATSFGITLDSIEKAMNFNNSHEAMHLGTMIALCKVL